MCVLLNLKESGVDVVVGLYDGSKSWKHAESVGLKVMTTAEAAKAADIIMILTPDEKQASIYKKDIEPNLTAGKALAFAHGFNIHFKQIVPPSDVDVFMIAPKAPGHTVRSEYKEGKGTPCLVAVYQDATGHCEDIALAYGAGIGAGYTGDASNIRIKGNADVTAFGNSGAAIGSGYHARGNSDITITDHATVTAASLDGCGIGSGQDASGKVTVTISGNASVNAQTRNPPAAIGSDKSSATVNIEDHADVTAVGRGVAIGTGYGHEGTSTDRKSTRLNSSHVKRSRMPSSA